MAWLMIASRLRSSEPEVQKLLSRAFGTLSAELGFVELTGGGRLKSLRRALSPFSATASAIASFSEHRGHRRAAHSSRRGCVLSA